MTDLSSEAQVDEFEFYRRQAFGTDRGPSSSPRPQGFKARQAADEEAIDGVHSLPHSPRRPSARPIDYDRSADWRSRSVKVRRDGPRNALAPPGPGPGPEDLDPEEERRLAMMYRLSPRHHSLCCSSRLDTRRQSESRVRMELLTPDVVPMRSFATTARGVVCTGESLRSSSSSVDETTNEINEFKQTGRRNSVRPPEDAQAGKTPDVYYVQVLGAAGVGKSSLCQQFLTSEYMGDIDPDEVLPQFAEEAICLMRLSVKLDGREAVLVLLDALPHVEDQEMELLAEMDAYVVVYGVDDRSSFVFAHSLLIELLEKRDLKTAVLLVGNKSDLVRTREIDAESGKAMAKKFSCKFVETSSTLNHGVDELLVLIVKEIRTRVASAEKPSKAGKDKEGNSTISRLFKKMSVRVKKPKTKHKGRLDE